MSDGTAKRVHQPWIYKKKDWPGCYYFAMEEKQNLIPPLVITAYKAKTAKK